MLSRSSLLDSTGALAPPGPAPDAVALWVLRLSSVDVSQLRLSVLDEAERGRADSLRCPKARLGYLASHVLLRELLGRRLGMPAGDVIYRRERCPSCGGPHGRPAAEQGNGKVHFSLSRRGDAVLVAIAATPIGVDLEAVPALETVDAVTELLHPLERAEVQSADPTERAERFTRIWTRKEAYLKGLGVGIATSLAAENLAGGNNTEGPPGWLLHDLPAPPGLVAAVAVAACV